MVLLHGVSSAPLVWEGPLWPSVSSAFLPQWCPFSIMAPWSLQVLRVSIPESSSICSSTPSALFLLLPPNPSSKKSPDPVISFQNGKIEEHFRQGAMERCGLFENWCSVWTEYWVMGESGGGRWAGWGRPCSTLKVLIRNLDFVLYTEQSHWGKNKQTTTGQMQSWESAYYLHWKEGKGVSGADKTVIDWKTGNMGSWRKEGSWRYGEGVGHIRKGTSNAREQFRRNEEAGQVENSTWWSDRNFRIEVLRRVWPWESCWVSLK